MKEITATEILRLREDVKWICKADEKLLQPIIDRVLGIFIERSLSQEAEDIAPERDGPRAVRPTTLGSVIQEIGIKYGAACGRHSGNPDTVFLGENEWRAFAYYMANHPLVRKRYDDEGVETLLGLRVHRSSCPGVFVTKEF